MGRITNLLNSYELKTTKLEDLYKIFKDVNDLDIPIIRFDLESGSKLLRQRINPPKKEISCLSELNYPPFTLLYSYGRVNLPYQSMFYACSFPNEISEDDPYPRVVTLMETSSFFRDKTRIGIERATLSRWDVIEPLNLIALPFSKSYERPCKDVVLLADLWLEKIKNTSINSDAKELLEYMSDEISKEFHINEGYFKIANFVNYILNVNEKTKDADGIIYPSVPAQGAGLNIAIKPSSADSKLKFVAASLCHLLKQKEQSYVAIMNISQKIKNGEITYCEKELLGEEKNIYEIYSKNLKFIN